MKDAEVLRRLERYVELRLSSPFNKEGIASPGRIELEGVRDFIETLKKER